MSSKRHHRHRRQGGTNPTTEPQNSLGVAQFSVSEVAQFSVSLDRALRQRAEQRLQEGLGVVPKVVCTKGKHRQGESGLLAKGAQPWPVLSSEADAAEPLDRATAIERAELRALRLFLCSPACRDPLAVLVIHNDLYRRAQACLVEAHRRLRGPIRSAQEDPLPRAVMAMGPQLEPRLAALLESLCTMDSHSREALFLKPEGEMMAVLDVLEPVG